MQDCQKTYPQMLNGILLPNVLYLLSNRVKGHTSFCLGLKVSSHSWSEPRHNKFHCMLFLFKAGDPCWFFMLQLCIKVPFTCSLAVADNKLGRTERTWNNQMHVIWQKTDMEEQSRDKMGRGRKEKMWYVHVPTSND